MILYKCKMCGGDLELTPGSQTIAECQYCGTTQTIPTIDDDKKTWLYNRANQYRMDCEFDKAYTAYENIINDKPDEAEAYWGMLLSEYGVEYVDDPATGKKIPTCHRTLIHSVTASENYKSACQYADSESRVMYEDEAAALDILQKKVLNASAKEEPYDVFICYKESDEAGNRTPDSVLAQDIYDALTDRGLRVFFSRISLEDKLGQDYEPCIFAALNSSRVMLMVTTNSDNCNAVWVKNEWKRYLDFMKTDKDKTLIPVYRDISPYALPDEFAKLQAQDMSKLGAIQDLVRGVEKILGKKKGSQTSTPSLDKQVVDKLEKGQKRTRCILFIALAGIVTFFGCILLSDASAFGMYSPDRIICYTDDWVMGANYFAHNATFFYLFIPVLLVTGLVINGVYGLRSVGARWYYSIIYFGAGLSIACLHLTGFTMGPTVWEVYGIFGALALLSTIFTYWRNKKALGIHLITILAMVVVLFITSLF